MCTYNDADPYFDIDYVGLGCNGQILSACAEGRAAPLDCSCFGAGFSCQTAGSVTFCGTGSECDPRNHAKTCDGNAVVFCNAGKLTRVACDALGFTSCAPDARRGCL